MGLSAVDHDGFIEMEVNEDRQRASGFFQVPKIDAHQTWNN